MALPELTRRLVEQKLGAFCERRVPPHVRGEIRLSFAFRGNTVTLIEERQRMLDPSQWSRIAIAQLRFDPESGQWRQHFADRNNRWHPYSDREPSANIEDLIAEIDRDPTGIFWG
jgi:hypothetical protein